MVDAEKLNKLGDLLVDQSVPMKARYRALFTLKNLGGKEAILNITKGFTDPSALLKHECAYCLGQMQDSSAIDPLIEVLGNKSEDPMVRHEAGEALGAIGLNTEKVTKALTEFASDSHQEVAETCQLALARLEWLEKKKQNLVENLSDNPYFSVDPAPPDANRDIPFLRQKLLNEEENMFERYRAMFQLRNDGSDQAILALCDGLKCKSALFRHEIAYVLGQIQSPLSIEALRVNLEDNNENHMVRHECAEALGALATDECVNILNRYLNDKEQVVKESCEVALDITDYEKSNDFQYANGLLTV
ncbi:Deoxyhypusine hydroxylase [Brachionus plicatilis]|uniref:Deoxyhypusine hydroxylase n=1 Tax=Brachionus plicatilis TaxID=10195 RepID=A0A3M7RJ44_BRAPC|nr:Deoxyhypusine hydroxylase [Brachionus plicatilis]